MPKTARRIVVYADGWASVQSLIPALRETFNEKAAAVTSIMEDGLNDNSTLNGETIAFFLPGIAGETSVYHEQIGENGNAKLRRYVENGGVFVGICAGAYYSCRDIVYDPPWGERKEQQPGLDFFHGLARGPVAENSRPPLSKRGNLNGGSWILTEIEYTPASGEAKETGICYGNGPALLPDENNPDVKVIARYKNVEGHPIAIASRKIGKGLAIFVGVLPDIRAQMVRDHLISKIRKDMEPLINELEQNEPGRQEVWQTIIDEIVAHHAKAGTAPKNLLKRAP